MSNEMRDEIEKFLRDVRARGDIYDWRVWTYDNGVVHAEREPMIRLDPIKLDSAER